MNSTRTISIYCDGGSRGNPGPAAAAFVVIDEAGHLVYQQGIFLGVVTNNIAEYNGVIKALLWLSNANNYDSVNFYLDSELVVKQLTGKYRIKDSTLKRLAAEIFMKLQTFNVKGVGISFTHIPRERNSHADALVNHTLDS